MPYVGVGYQPGSDTSLESAERVVGYVATLRARVLGCFEAVFPAGLTADEVAATLNESVLACRPRCTELFQAGAIVDTGYRRQNRSGHRARVLAVPAAPRLGL